MKKISLIGNGASFGLERSYQRAFEHAGMNTQLIDLQQLIGRHIKGGRLGRKVNDFLPVESWKQKANREAVLGIISYRPDVVFVFCNAPWSIGASALLKTVLPHTRLVLIWPDTVFNIKAHILELAPFADLLACYSRDSVPIFEAMGFKKVIWVPLAADIVLHGIDSVPPLHSHDITFIGGWRPEREAFFKPILAHFPKLRVNINGPLWDKYSQDPLIRKFAQYQIVTGREYAAQINRSAINLNIIDPTNFPAANMRFFEIPVASAAQFSTACPEMEGIYRQGETIVYCDAQSILEQIESYLSTPGRLLKLAEQAKELTTKAHTYGHRIDQIFEVL